MSYGIDPKRFKEAPKELLSNKPVDIGQAKLDRLLKGSTKKSKYELEKEAAEQKQREHEEEAARVYQDFVASFDADDRSTGKAFVRAGADASSRYQPPTAPTGPRASTSRSYDYEKPAASRMRSFGDDDEPVKEPPNRKRRQMDSFLEEMKREQAHRDARDAARAAANGGMPEIPTMSAYSGPTGSYDMGDETTTNIHVGNLPTTVSDLALGDLFARMGGPVASVKIMWPRLEGVPSTNLGGFVAMMKRADAEKAFEAIDNLDWGGNVLRCSWGKSVPIPPRPVFVSSERRKSRSRSRSRSPKRTRHRSRSTSRSPSPRLWPELSQEDERFVDAIANKIKDHGPRFENTLKDRERGNPRFAFLEDDRSPKFHYLRMLLDRRYKPPVNAPVTFEDEGYASIYSTDSAEQSESKRGVKSALGRLARKRFEAMLRSITLTRERIAKPMAFALEHADASDDIAGIIVQSLLVHDTPVPRKLARLYLISDILHNSSAAIHNAWRFRMAFEKVLPPVFDHMNAIYRSFPSRMKAEAFRQQVAAVIAVWDAWLIFTPGVVAEFTTRLVDGPDAAPADDGMDVDGVPALPEPSLDAAAGKAAGFKRVPVLG